MSKIQITILESPYDQWDDPKVQSLYLDSITLRLKGYQHSYGHGVLPFDGTDFIGTHTLFYLDLPSGRQLISTHRTVTLEQCRNFNLKFPYLSLAETSPNPDHLRWAAKAIESLNLENQPYSYQSAWTIDPDVRKNRKLVHEIKNLLCTTYVGFHLEKKIKDIFLGGNPRFKTDSLFESWGFERATLSGEKLPPFGAAFAFNEPIVLLHLKQFSTLALQTFERNQAQWKTRSHFFREPNLLLSPKKAA